MSEPKADPSELLAFTAEIVASHVSNNNVPVTDLPALIQRVYDTIARLGKPDSAGAPERPMPAVPVRKSVTPDYIICLEDGKKLKMLKRYLRSRYDMTPEEYRAKWNLPADYPMVAPNYAKLRSKHAKQIGLGKKPPEKKRSK